MPNITKEIEPWDIAAELLYPAAPPSQSFRVTVAASPRRLSISALALGFNPVFVLYDASKGSIVYEAPKNFTSMWMFELAEGLCLNLADPFAGH